MTTCKYIFLCVENHHCMEKGWDMIGSEGYAIADLPPKLSNMMVKMYPFHFKNGLFSLSKMDATSTDYLQLDFWSCKPPRSLPQVVSQMFKA